MPDAEIIGRCPAWVHTPGGVNQDDVLVIADELGVSLGLTHVTIGLTLDAAVRLADDLAEAVATSRNMALRAHAGREQAALHHARRVVEAVGLAADLGGWPV